MNLRHWIATLLTGVLLAAQGADAQTRNDTEPPRQREDDEDNRHAPVFSPDVVIIRGQRQEFIATGPADQSNAAANALAAAGAKLIRVHHFPTLRRRALVFDLRRVPLRRAKAVLAQSAPLTRIDRHNIYHFAGGTPRLYAASMIGAPNGTCRLPGLRIGIIDGPVDIGHKALAGARVVRHSVLAQGERPPNATHGTGVAALIVGQDPDGALSGFAAGAQLFAVTTFARAKRGSGADVERIGAALDWLAANRVRLVNMSFAGPPNVALEDLLAAAAQRGTVLIAAAGNGGSASAAWPAASPHVIAVTAVDAAGRRYRQANTGAHIEFAAPGVDLYVAKRNGGSYASGTSFAAPIVTALAARVMARGAGSANAVRAKLRAHSRDLGTPGHDSQYGWGLVRAPGC
ncbi:MAG: S8 family serine peptidase [Rhodobacteraceae bacterium]|nr:S8 family serine peptidase [Paracoccaceae bacterium]